MFVTIVCVILNVAAVIAALVTNDHGIILRTLGLLLSSVATFFVVFFFFGVVTTITEWKQICCKGWKKILYVFTFPLFMFTYVPIAIIALFKRVKWEPIKHTVSKDLTEIRK